MLDFIVCSYYKVITNFTYMNILKGIYNYYEKQIKMILVLIPLCTIALMLAPESPTSPRYCSYNEDPVEVKCKL